MLTNGINYKNSTDLTMSVVSFVPVVGWVIGVAYFIGDPIIEKVTGKNISAHIENAVNSSTDYYKGFINWLSRIKEGW